MSCMNMFLAYSCDEYEKNWKTVFWYVAVNVYFCSSLPFSTGVEWSSWSCSCWHFCIGLLPSTGDRRLCCQAVKTDNTV